MCVAGTQSFGMRRAEGGKRQTQSEAGVTALVSAHSLASDMPLEPLSAARRGPDSWSIHQATWQLQVCP